VYPITTIAGLFDAPLAIDPSWIPQGVPIPSGVVVGPTLPQVNPTPPPSPAPARTGAAEVLLIGLAGAAVGALVVFAALRR
jgi:hypothetical protein